MLQVLKFVDKRLCYRDGAVMTVSDLYMEFEEWAGEPPTMGRINFSKDLRECLKYYRLPWGKYGSHRVGVDVVRGFKGLGCRERDAAGPPFIPPFLKAGPAASILGIDRRTMVKRAAGWRVDPERIPLRKLRPAVVRLSSVCTLLEKSAMAARASNDDKAYQAITDARTRLRAAALAPPGQYSAELNTAIFLLYSAGHVFGVNKSLEYLRC